MRTFGLRVVLRRLRDWRHRRRMRRILLPTSRTHSDYLDLQLSRTLAKSDVSLPTRAVLFAERVNAVVELSKLDVLCVGCRNSAELDHLQACGASTVVGVDLFSEDSRILVMDMHSMTFADNSFDLLYSSHSFEHALDPTRAAREFVRVLRPGGVVALEVPVHFTARGADLRDYESGEQVLAHFAPRVSQSLLAEEVTSQVGAPPSLRLIFRVGKSPLGES